MSHYSHKSMPDAKFESGSFSNFGDMTSQNFSLEKERVIKFGYLPSENGFNQEIISRRANPLTLRQYDAFTDDVPPFGLFIEQLDIFLVTTFDFRVSIIFCTLSRNGSIFTLHFPA